MSSAPSVECRTQIASYQSIRPRPAYFGAKALDTVQWTLTVVALFLNKHKILSEAQDTDRNSLTFYPCKNLLLIREYDYIFILMRLYKNIMLLLFSFNIF